MNSIGSPRPGSRTMSEKLRRPNNTPELATLEFHTIMLNIYDTAVLIGDSRRLRIAL
jgi:hypothetical protein